MGRSALDELAQVVSGEEQRFHVVTSAHELGELLRDCFKSISERVLSLDRADKVALATVLALLRGPSTVRSEERAGVTLLLGEVRLPQFVEPVRAMWILYGRDAPDSEVVLRVAKERNARVVFVLPLEEGAAPVERKDLQGNVLVEVLPPRAIAEPCLALMYDSFTQEYLNSIVSFPGGREMVADVLAEYGCDGRLLLEEAAACRRLASTVRID